MNWRKSAVIRKSLALAQRVPRAMRRMRAGDGHWSAAPPLLVNSFPKSGTHLLLQIVECWPGLRDYGTFLASHPSMARRPRTAAAMCRRIRRICPGELLAGHIYHDPACASALNQCHARVLFIYRDLRDVVVSESHYLARMNRWHRMHRHFAALPDDGSRLMAAIRGVPESECGCEYPDIGERFRRYMGWMDSPDVLCLRFEDLAGQLRERTVRHVVETLGPTYWGREVSTEQAAAQAMHNIDPRRSRTFRRGSVGDWRGSFSPAHIDAMKECAGNLLVELNYEKDLAW